VNEFRDNLLARIEQAEEAVRQAVERQDAYAAEVHGADLANLRRLADEHGLTSPCRDRGRDSHPPCGG
jgi:hypothetical protein